VLVLEVHEIFVLLGFVEVLVLACQGLLTHEEGERLVKLLVEYSYFDHVFFRHLFVESNY